MLEKAPPPSGRPSPDTHGGSQALVVHRRRSERQRQVVVSTVFVIYVLLITEGIFRKWLFPQYNHALYFIRDPFVIGLYFYALANGIWPQKYAVLSTAMIFSVLALMLAAVQFVGGSGIGISPALVALYGWRNYFLYIPLAFLIGTNFEQRDIRRIGSLTLLLAIPISILVFAQFHSSPDAKINVGSAENIAEQFHGLGLDATHSRPMGPFTSDLGESRFTTAALAFVLVYWIRNQKKKLSEAPIAVIGTASVLMALAYSGSRGAVLSAAILITLSLFGLLRLGGRKVAVRKTVTFLIVALILVAIATSIFSDGIASFLTRWDAAYESEKRYFTGGILGRSLYGFIDFTRLMFESPILGFGLGSGGNASTILGGNIRGLTPNQLAESDWSRHILDLGPVFGVVFIAFRLYLVGWLTRRVWRSTSTIAYPLFAAVVMDLLTGQITGHGIVTGFAWILLGLTLAATRLPEEQGTDVAIAAKPRFANVMR